MMVRSRERRRRIIERSRGLIAQLCMIDTLSVAVAVVIGDGCLDPINETSQALKRNRY
jgi:hypothetical protein